MITALRDLLERRGAHFEVLHHPPAYSGTEEAQLTGLPAASVVKAIVLDSGGRHALAVLPANRDLDMNRLKAAMGDSHVHLATEAEITQDLPQYELGAVPPFGSLTGMPLYVDGEVLGLETVAFADGVQTETVVAPAAEVFAGERATVALISDWDRPVARHGL